ncbi:MAG: alpha-mannosidase [Acidimicrobiales bacterium]
MSLPADARTTAASHTSSEPARRRVNVVPHTHWDREWYSPFRTFQLRLVDLVDKLLALMESDPSYARFLFDGHMAAVDDYLELRPENEARLRALASAGRISFGPWYVLMDEFLVSGETVVRNLQLGLERAAAFGGAMEIGYLPDMFGHIGQMPQILQAAGFSDAVVWRGVPSAIDRTAFCWESPDGSVVRAEYLLEGYSAGASLGRDAKAFVRRLEAFEEGHEAFLVGPILFPNGTDHQEPQPWLGRVVAEANAIQDRYEIVLCSLPEALAGATRSGLPSWRGELRSGARANVLMGVASNRVDVKQAAARAERTLEHLAEPMAALFMPPGQYPGSALAVAWRELVRNSAHDSVCACSHDEVAAVVLNRYAEATRIAEGVAERALKALASSLARPCHVAVNASSCPRSGVIELVIGGQGPLEGAQILDEHVGVAAELVLTTTEVRGVLSQLGSQDQMGEGAYVAGVEVEEDDTGINIAVRVLPERSNDLQLEQIKSDLLARFGLRPDAPVRVKLDQASSRRLLARVENVPGYGWKAWQPGPLSDPVTASAEADGTVLLANSRVTVALSADSTFSINGLTGFNRLVDSGDFGDTYNYSPPEHDLVADTAEQVSLSLLETGPVRATARVERTYRWPERIDERRRARAGEREVTISSLIELRAGEQLVRVTTSFDNTCRDHRLRAWFPLAEPTDHSRAECAFDIVERGLLAEGGPSERPLATYPSRRFVQAGGLSVFHEGLCEYELVDITEAGGTPLAHGLALTLLRATGMLSRLTMLNRPLPAGPVDALEGPQLQGPLIFKYALALGEIDPYALAEEAFCELAVAASLGGGELEVEASLLKVSGAQVSALRRVAGGALELRVFNPDAKAARVEVHSNDGLGTDEGSTPVRGQLVDLRGRYVASFEGSFELGPHRIATARLAGK